MQTLDITRPDMPDLQFVLLVTALCTARVPSLNVPVDLRTAMFNRCWTLIHDSPPPGRPEERVLDLRPWNEVTVEAMVETIRGVLTEAGIRTLIWDHQPGEPTSSSTPEAQPLIDRLDQLYPRLSEASDASPQADIWQLLGKIAASMAAFPSALERRAGEITANDTDTELAAKLLEGVDVMRRSINTFLTWGRHYARLADDNSQAADEADDNR